MENPSAPDEISLPKSRRKIRVWFIPVLIFLIIGGGFLTLRLVESSTRSSVEAALATGEINSAQKSLDPLIQLPGWLLKDRGQLLRLRAEIHMKTGSYPEAENDLEQVLAEEPGDALALDMQARLFWLQGKQTEAIATADKVLELDPTLPFPYALKAQGSYTRGKEEEALTQAAEAIQHNDTSGLAHLIRARIYSWREDFAAAQPELDAARQQLTNPVEAHALQAYMDIRRGNTAALEEHIQVLKDDYPEHPASLWVQGLAAADKNDTEMAATLCDRALELEERPEFLFGRFVVSSTLKEIADNISLLDRALELYPGFTPAAWEKLRFEIDKGTAENAEEQIDRMVEKTAKSPAAYITRAIFRGEHSNFTGALQDYQTAIELDPESITPLLGRFYFHLERYENSLANQTLDKIIALEPDKPDTHAARSMMALQENNVDLAMQEIDTALSLKPKNILFRLRKADLHLILGELDKAKELIGECLKQDPLFPNTLLEATNIALQENDLIRAIGYANSGLEVLSHSPYMLRNRAKVFLAQKNYQKARDDVLISIKWNDKDAYAYSMLALINLKEEKYDQADSNISRAMALNSQDPNIFSLAAEIALNSNDAKKASERLDRGLAISPNDINLLRMAAALNLRFGRIDLSQSQLEKLLGFEKMLTDDEVSFNEQMISLLKKRKPAEPNLGTYIEASYSMLQIDFPQHWVAATPLENSVTDKNNNRILFFLNDINNPDKQITFIQIDQDIVSLGATGGDWINFFLPEIAQLSIKFNLLQSAQYVNGAKLPFYAITFENNGIQPSTHRLYAAALPDRVIVVEYIQFHGLQKPDLKSMMAIDPIIASIQPLE